MLSKIIQVILALFAGSKSASARPSGGVCVGRTDPGKDLVKHYEACASKLPSGKIGPYVDAAGIATIGWGNTRYPCGTPVRLSDAPITQDKADEIFDQTYADFRMTVQASLPPSAKPHEIDAFTSLAYNIGLSAFRNSTALRLFAAGNKKGAGDSLEQWTRARGKVLKGLQRRRRAERLVFDGLPLDEAIRRAEVAFP